ncbi:uncharacterized protein LOC143921563 [Arctopsyche grandis]|uniref:uncharacterized protein LOC143921563 n=1 Tax=Arctopsyche grandis TaxID=121162 RepID=UPI00406D65E9
MRKGENGGVQLKIKQEYKNAHCINCYAHQLNLIMKNAATTLSVSRIFFANLLKIPVFFSYSPYRLKILNKQANIHLPRPSATRWDFNIRAVNKVYENQEILKQCFQELQSTQQATDKTIADSSTLLHTLNDEKFLFWLKLFHKLMPHVEIIYNQMQSREIEICSIQNNLKNFKNAILQIRNSYSELSSSQFQEARDMCDVISSDMEQRYSFNNHLMAAKLFDKENFKKYLRKMPVEEVNQTVESYPMLEKEKLLTEFQVFYERVEMHSFNNLLSLLKFIHANKLCDVLGELTKLLKILITTPMTTAEPERCFSTLNKIKTYLRNTMSQERLTALSMLSIEKDMIRKLTNFNEKVIDKFANSKNRQMDFVLK